MNIKKRIFNYTPQPIIRPVQALLVLVAVAMLIFVLLYALTHFQVVIPQQNMPHTPLLVTISAVCALILFIDAEQRLKFPFFIQRYLIHPKLAHDLTQLALRSSDAVIVGHRKIRAHWWQRRQQQLQLKLHHSQQAEWFSCALHQVFNTRHFSRLKVHATDELIGQEVFIYYLAQSRHIVQIVSAARDDDFEYIQRYINTPYAQSVYLHRIPTQLMQDINQITKIEAVRRLDEHGFHLNITTLHGNRYDILSKAKRFDLLEQALSPMIDFVAYRQFKHSPQMRQQIISTVHPQRYRRVWPYLVYGIVLLVAFQLHGLAGIVVLCLICYLYRTKHQRHDAPFIVESVK